MPKRAAAEANPPAKKATVGPAALWEVVTGSILPDLQLKDPAKFMDVVTGSGEMTAQLVDKLVKRANHTCPQLAASDHVELAVVDESELRSSRGIDWTSAINGVTLFTMVMGNLPYKIRAAIEETFREHARGKRARGVSVSSDGRLEIRVRDFSDPDELFNAYINAVQQTADAECVEAPDREDPEEVDPSDYAQPDTLLWDAYELRLNDNEGALQEEFEEDCATFFDLDDMTTKMLVSQPLEAVWCRKPRVRLVVCV